MIFTGSMLFVVGMLLGALQCVCKGIYKCMPDVEWKEQELRSLIATQEKKIKRGLTWVFWVAIATVLCCVYTPMYPAGVCLIFADIVLCCCCAVPYNVRKRLIEAVNEGENGT